MVVENSLELLSRCWQFSHLEFSWPSGLISSGRQWSRLREDKCVPRQVSGSSPCHGSWSRGELGNEYFILDICVTADKRSRIVLAMEVNYTYSYLSQYQVFYEFLHAMKLCKIANHQAVAQHMKFSCKHTTNGQICHVFSPTISRQIDRQIDKQNQM